MINNALKLKSPKLAEATAEFDETQLRELAARVAARAVSVQHLEQPEVAAGLAALDAKTYGDQALISQLTELADTIEAPYVAALDRNEDVQDNPKLMAAFMQARAVASLYLALSSNIARDGGNAVYEALYAGVSEADVLALL